MESGAGSELSEPHCLYNNIILLAVHKYVATTTIWQVISWGANFRYFHGSLAVTKFPSTKINAYTTTTCT